MNPRTLLLPMLLTLAVNAQAGPAFEDQVGYSTEGYCDLVASGVEPRYLAAYAKKLGVTPGGAVCARFRERSGSGTAAWDFRDRRPYPGSAIRLSQVQV